MHEHGNEMLKHDQICWNHKVTYQTKQDNTFSEKNVSQHMKIGVYFVFYLCAMYEMLFLSFEHV